MQSGWISAGRSNNADVVASIIKKNTTIPLSTVETPLFALVWASQDGTIFGFFFIQPLSSAKFAPLQNLRPDPTDIFHQAQIAISTPQSA
jgi:hypothetical protein